MDFLKRVWVDKCLFRTDVKEKKNWMCRCSLEYARRGDFQTAPSTTQSTVLSSEWCSEEYYCARSEILQRSCGFMGDY